MESKTFDEQIKEFEDKHGITYRRLVKKMMQGMSEEYNKGGSFKDYVDKIAQKDRTTAEEVMKKAVVKEYYKSIKEGVNKGENIIGYANDRTDTNQDSYKPACDS